MSTSDPIAGVSVISTGTRQIRPEHVGPTRKTALPVAAHLPALDGPAADQRLRHRARRRAWSCSTPGRTAPRSPTRSYFPGGATGLVYRRLAKFDIGPDETLTASCAALGHTIADVAHRRRSPTCTRTTSAGSRARATPRSCVSRPGVGVDCAGRSPQPRGLLRDHIDLPGLRWKHDHARSRSPTPRSRRSPNGHDLFGDGSLVLLPTPGHTPGSLSTARPPARPPPLLMVGDLTYDDDLLAAGQAPRRRRQAADAHRHTDGQRAPPPASRTRRPARTRPRRRPAADRRPRRPASLRINPTGAPA